MPESKTPIGALFMMHKGSEFVDRVSCRGLTKRGRGVVLRRGRGGFCAVPQNGEAMFWKTANNGYICTLKTSPDGGIGRRVGLKHQWSNPCRFDPGSGY